MNLGVVAAIARKDIVDAIRNRYLLVALLTPLLVAILFRFLMPGMDTLSLKLVVHDSGNSNLVSQLRASPRIEFVPAESADVVPKIVESAGAVGGLVIPANFDADIAAGTQPEVSAYINHKRSGIEQAMFRQLLERQIMGLVKQEVPARLTWIDVARDPGAPGLEGVSLDKMLLPLLLLLSFTMSGALVVPLLLVEEKEKRTLDFLLTSPASLADIIAAKAVTGVVYSVIIAGVLLALNYKLIRNWPLTLLIVMSGLFLIVAIGLFMGSLFQNTMQVNTWAGLAVMLLLAPGFPSIRLPPAFETGLLFIPTNYFAEALRLSLAGTSSTRIWWQLSVVLACTGLAFAAAVWGLRRQRN